MRQEEIRRMQSIGYLFEGENFVGQDAEGVDVASRGELQRLETHCCERRKRGKMGRIQMEENESEIMIPAWSSSSGAM